MCTYISIFTNETQNHVYTDEGPWSTDACTAVCDDGSRSMNVPHVRNKCEQLLRLCGRSVVGPSRVVKMSHTLYFVGLRTEEFM